MDRRAFLCTLAAAGGVGAISGGASADKPKITEGFLREPARELPIAGKCDVIVAGGGPAGMAAAIGAARQGAKVVLLESKGCVGGIWTKGLLGCLLGFNYSELDREILAKLDKYQAYRTRSPERNFHAFVYEPEYMKVVCDELLAEAGVRVRLWTSVVSAIKNGRKLEAVITESKGGREAWVAKSFIDCTGDGDLSALAGCGFDTGGATASDPDQPASLIAMFTLPDDRGILKFVANEHTNYDSVGEAIVNSKKELRKEFERLNIHPSYGDPTIFRINRNLFIMMANHEYDIPVDDPDKIGEATARARREIVDITEALVKDSWNQPGHKGAWSNLRLVATADQIYHRRARRIHGRYKMKVEDCFNGAVFEDAVAMCRFGIDVHAVSKHMNKILPAGSPFKKSVLPYQIPLRACQSADIDNLYMAGRCVSGDFFIQASYRITGTAVEMGYNVGKAAAKCRDCTKE